MKPLVSKVNVNHDVTLGRMERRAANMSGLHTARPVRTLPRPTPISPWKAWKEGYGKSHFPPASFLHLFRDCPCSLIGLLLIWYLIA